MTKIFQSGFSAYACTGDAITAEHDGFSLTATIYADEDYREPWKDECGHGPVSDWTRRAKAPGEMVLNSDHGSKRFYDFAEACRIARRDGWGTRDGRKEGESARAYAARAALADFEALRAWCNDEWTYCGVGVTVAREGVELVERYESALWGVELNYPGSDNAYLLEVAEEQADEALSLARERLSSLVASAEA